MKAVAIIILGTLSLAAGPTLADGQRPQNHPVHGQDLMTPLERAEHRARMRSAKSVEEREQIRREQHELMKQRAKEQGITLPDEPPAGGGMRPGGGSGMERGRGMGGR